VAPNGGCGGTDIANLQLALDKADDQPDADRIFLGAWTYLAPTTSGFDYSQSGAPVEIIGKGAGQTVLTSPSGASNVLRLFGGPGGSVHDLRIRMPDNVVYGSTGLSTDGAARRIDVIEDPQQPQNLVRHGVHLEHGGVLEDSSVTLDGVAPSTTGVWMDVGGGTVRNSTIVANLGLASAHGGTIERSRFFTGGMGVAAGAGVTTVANSFIWAGGQPGVGLYASAQPGSAVTINADGVTIVGSAHTSSRAALASTLSAPAENAAVNLTNSIIRDSHLEAAASGTGQARIAISYSDMQAAVNETHGNASIAKANVSDVGDAGFANPQLGDYHLLPSSPLIDAGDPSSAQGLDLDGKPLVVDGNLDGAARRDIGSFEFQTGLPAAGDPAPAGGAVGGGGIPIDTQAPLISGFRATRAPRGTRFRYTLSEPAGITLTIKRVRSGRRVGMLRRIGAKGANSIRFSGRIGKRALRPGRYRAVIAATDVAGNHSALRKLAFRIVAG
jgi:hypothetical protein